MWLPHVTALRYHSVYLVRKAYTLHCLQLCPVMPCTLMPNHAKPCRAIPYQQIFMTVVVSIEQY